jgi:hypothetical protein
LFSFKTKTGTENMWSLGGFMKSGKTFPGISELFFIENQCTRSIDLWTICGMVHGGPTAMAGIGARWG